MIAIFGAPGSGKSIQGQLMAKKYGWKWISARDILTSTGDKDINFALEHGMTITNDIYLKTFANTLSSIQRGNSWKQIILDGFPNHAKQIYWMVENDFLKYLSAVIILRVPRGELWKRMLERGRADDNRAAIERRQDDYERSITGMIHVLRENNIEVFEVDGSNSPEDVLKRIEEKLFKKII